MTHQQNLTKWLWHKKNKMHMAVLDITQWQTCLIYIFSYTMAQVLQQLITWPDICLQIIYFTPHFKVTKPQFQLFLGSEKEKKKEKKDPLILSSKELAIDKGKEKIKMALLPLILIFCFPFPSLPLLSFLLLIIQKAILVARVVQDFFLHFIEFDN